MKVVRQRMIKPFLKELPAWKLFLLLPILGILSSCNPTELTGKGVSGNVVTNDGSFDNKAYVYEYSPYFTAGPNYGPNNVDMSSLLDRQAKLITNNSRLTGNCAMMFSSFFVNTTVNLNDCIYSLNNETGSAQPVPRNADRTFIFPPNSPEFYQTNALYHISQGTQKFFEQLAFAYNWIHTRAFDIPKSMPPYLVSNKLFWFKAMSSIDKKLFNFDHLTSYAQCDLDGNASFSPAGPSLCFGGISLFPNFYFVQDPSIIHHELGHALVSVMMNMRNGTDSSTYHPLRSNLGSYGYNESGSINEGIADYFSYIMHDHQDKPGFRMGDYALGITVNQSRPLSEADPMHITGISEISEERLSYPQYLLYDPNYPESLIEDKHYAGQIISHYLVALTNEFKKECNVSGEIDGGHSRATSYVMLLLAETLSELGDLNAKGVDNTITPFGGNYFFNNLDTSNSYLWTQIVNPVTYRRFSQVMAKNIYKYISGSGKLCPTFDKNKSEKLLDDYGLLLFKTYNDNGNSTKNKAIDYRTAVPHIPTQALTQVSENNRRKSVLISKNLVELAERTDENPSRVSFYIIDNSSDMSSLLQDLLYKGFTVPVSQGVAGTEYNNNNIKVSPGEVVAVIPNLLNNSNSTMAGVQLLATDWDHVHITSTDSGNFKPCVIDTATTVDQGGEAGNSCTTTESSFNRLVANPVTQKFPAAAVAPVCFVQLDEGDSSRWVSQNEFRKKQGLSLLDKDCLGYSNPANSETDFTFSPHECLVRFLPGANSANFSKIDPQKTYYESVVKESEVNSFNSGNLLIMEVNKWIPPGTKFRCRMRARFSNCSDCYTDGSSYTHNGFTYTNDDFIDAEYNGNKPFKVINFDFFVND